ncbi:hypothetical protein CHU92_06575 [Flavobacterium cyanobacteriorum]|uniref:Uncharacterized protein n=1 Tax=Flavobacterium cyanobacteriorum TaxID=2022802 RepID=A0A255Z9I4_9FLAO|nr:hypothetical protein [Flavobacterium cyanobacteriorum]OYQ38128.1 hypothetical protein CHU92_06575 [Flavobacterium cyanobacteriorum]
MQKFRLELLLKVIGIGSASGLFFGNGSLFIISDNSNMLYDYNMTTNRLEKIPLSAAAPLENIIKKDKPDLEAIAVCHDELYLFGSGSTNKRNSIYIIDVRTKQVKETIDATDLYLGMQEFGETDAENFNIEAAVYNESTWYLFNRGNGPKGKNGVYTITGNIKDGSYQMLYNDVKLPKIKGARASFTDAVKVGNKIYFLAAAEKSNSTYHDGEVAGTLLGSLNPETMKVERTQVISTKNKFEGITLYKETAETIAFLLCEDADSDIQESDIYTLTINK